VEIDLMDNNFILTDDQYNLISSFHFVFPKLVKKVKKNKNFVSKNRNLKKVKK
jgi:hypothetical protein